METNKTIGHDRAKAFIPLEGRVAAVGEQVIKTTAELSVRLKVFLGVSSKPINNVFKNPNWEF